MTTLDRLGSLLTPEQVQLMNELVPEKCPDPEDTDRAIWMYAGERGLVRLLTLAFQKANEPEQDQPTFF